MKGQIENLEQNIENVTVRASMDGTMTGEVTFVSVDLKVNNSGSAYYVVETSVDAGDLRNRLGKEANLKVGMLCETRILVEEKRV